MEVFIVLVLIGIVIIFIIKKRKQNYPAAAGMNFDLDTVQPFLSRLSNVLDTGFTDEDIRSIKMAIEEMNEDHQVKDIGTYPVVYHGKPAKVRVEAEIHIEGDSREVVLNLFGPPDLVQMMDDEMMKYADELGI
jgi:hypothetical protein